MSTKPKTRSELTREWIRRFVAYDDSVTYFGGNSVMGAWAGATGGLVAGAHVIKAALLRRFTLTNAKGDDLTTVAEERGASRADAERAGGLVVFQPVAAVANTVINGVDDIFMPETRVNVDDASGFQVGDEVRVVTADGAASEIAVITLITQLVGSADIHLPPLAGSYPTGSIAVAIMQRETLPPGTQVRSVTGAVFELVEAVTVSDRNPLFHGETMALSLADKARVEAVVPGVAGNAPARAIDSLVVANRKIAAVSNPESLRTGSAGESDADLRYRTAHLPTLMNQETLAWAEAQCMAANNMTLRAFKAGTLELRTMEIHVLRKNRTVMTPEVKAAMKAWLEERVRSNLKVNLSDMTTTAVEVEAACTLLPNASLQAAWRSAAERLAEYLDLRRWPRGQDVDDVDLLALVDKADGVADTDRGAFTPATNVVVAADSLPVFTRLKLTDLTTGDVINGSVETTY